jgi:hypothetical protein
MPRKPVDFETVREIAMALPGVEESSSDRGQAFKVRGKLLTWTAINASAEQDSLAVRIDANLRAELLAAEPDVFYLTPHYESYPVVLVRLARISRESLRKLLGTACLFVSSKAPKSRAKSQRRKPALLRGSMRSKK